MKLCKILNVDYETYFISCYFFPPEKRPYSTDVDIGQRQGIR